MIKHATSHGLSVFFCSVAAAFIVETTKPIWPQLNSLLIKMSISIQSFMKVNLSIDYLNILIAATALSVIWGMIFKLSQSKN